MLTTIDVLSRGLVIFVAVICVIATVKVAYDGFYIVAGIFVVFAVLLLDALVADIKRV